MVIPHFEMLMRPLLKYASDNMEHSFRDTIEFLAAEYNLSEEEKKELLPSGRMSIFDNRVGWTLL
jgi:restriction system protein